MKLAKLDRIALKICKRPRKTDRWSMNPKCYWKKGRMVKCKDGLCRRFAPRLRVRCGCCNSAVELYPDYVGTTLEINGVIASVGDWRRILLPLLDSRSYNKNYPMS